MIIYNEGDTPERQNPIFVADGPTPRSRRDLGYTLGNELLQAYKQGKNPTVDFKVYGVFTDRFLNQVIAETRGGDPNHVVVVGAHLDSCPPGPGINDDGSGTATLLAQAEDSPTGHYNLRQKIRFAWWGAEENGLVGSNYYASTPQRAGGGQDRRDARLRHARVAQLRPRIYDGDGNAAPGNPVGPEGSGKVEQVPRTTSATRSGTSAPPVTRSAPSRATASPRSTATAAGAATATASNADQLASRRLPIVGP